MKIKDYRDLQCRLFHPQYILIVERIYVDAKEQLSDFRELCSRCN